MFHSIVNTFADCSFPKAFSISYLVYGMIITALFTNFYIQSYLKEKSEKLAAIKEKSLRNGAALVANGNGTKKDE